MRRASLVAACLALTTTSAGAAPLLAIESHVGDGAWAARSVLVLHAGPQPLARSRLADGPFDGEVRILRPPASGR